MALGSLRRRRPPLANPGLRDAIERHQTRPSPETRALLHRRLLEGPLLIALRELPRQLETGSEALAGELPVEFVSQPGPDGRRALAGFSDPEAVAARAPTAVALAVDPRAVLGWLAEEGLGGLLLNPEGPSTFVSSDDLLDLLGHGDARLRRGRRRATGHESESRIQTALERLLGAEDGAAAVTVLEPRTGRRVHFTSTPDGSLLLVVPRADLGSDELERARLMFRELAGLHEDDDPEDDLVGPGDFQAIFTGDPGRAVKAALKAFTWIFGFPGHFDLEVAGP